MFELTYVYQSDFINFVAKNLEIQTIEIFVFYTGLLDEKIKKKKKQVA